MIDVVCGVLRDHDRILIARRRAGQRDAGLWELPGGKVEGRESFETALRRELNEELRIDADVGERLAVATTSTLRLTAYRVERWSGEPVALVHDAFLWLLPARTVDYPMPDADVRLLRTLIERWSSLAPDMR